MKIKLSKAQWEGIGKKAGWITAEQYDPKKVKAYELILNAIGGSRFRSGGSSMRDYTEFHVYDVYGEAHIQIGFDEKTGAIRIEKYYDSEFLQNEYGNVGHVVFDIENPHSTISIIKSKIEKMKIG